MTTGTTVRPHGLRELLEEAASLAGAFLARCDDPSERVTTNPSPELIRSRIDLALPREGHSQDRVVSDLRSVLDLSVLTGHTGFSNQLYSGYDPVAIVGEWMTAVLNTSMYTYEVAPVLTLIEYEVVRKLCAAVGLQVGLSVDEKYMSVYDVSDCLGFLVGDRNHDGEARETVDGSEQVTKTLLAGDGKRACQVDRPALSRFALDQWLEQCLVRRFPICKRLTVLTTPNVPIQIAFPS